MSRVLVSGVAGFIGSRIANTLIARGHQVLGVDNFMNGKPDSAPPGCEHRVLDLADEASFFKLPRSCDAVLHIAGQASGEKSFRDPHVDLDSNFRTTLNLLDYSRQTGVKKFLHASSMGGYGDSCASVVQENSPPCLSQAGNCNNSSS